MKFGNKVHERNGRKIYHGNWKVLVAAVFCAMALDGCAALPTAQNPLKIVLTTGFGQNEVFRIEDASCSLPELMVYLINTQDEYEKTLGSGIWKAKVSDQSLEESVKESCLAKIAQIKTMNLLAAQNGIVLSNSEQTQAQAAAKAYYQSLNETEIKAMDGVTQDTIRQLYEEYALADKLYQYTIRDINPEVSDDEARTITVQQIMLKTYTLDASGQKVPVSDTAKQAVYQKMQMVQKQIGDGTAFETLAEKYNEADAVTISFGKGDVDSALENAAFNLATDQVSDIIETKDGYEIIKCMTTFNRQETEANKVKIVEERKKEAFGQQYDDFADNLTRELNTELWAKVTMPHDAKITTRSFFEVYDKYFPKDTMIK
ncbi:MAG: peptidylprolyl isomerase [Butyrivibrio sp.]|jgi:foldase protein PrsA|nr:peptidylprolyl isomerase [Butyrivibrio sp.]